MSLYWRPPGDLYSSLGPALAVDGVAEALSKSAAKKVYICNLVTKPGQTDGFQVHDFASEIERLSGNELDYVLYNNVRPDEELLQKYAHDNEYWVGFDTQKLADAGYEAIGGDFVSRYTFGPTSSADPLAVSRSFIRHSGDKVARAIMKIYFS